MRINKVIKARELAVEFCARAQLLERLYHAHKREQAKKDRGEIEYVNSYDPTTGSKESGALKRASMDLTRALAELRKPQ